MFDASTSRCWAEIDPSALRHNLSVAKSLLAPGTGIMAVVKANAYGHGVRAVVETLRPEVDSFAVANVQEAEEVRRFAPDRPVSLLSPASPAERARIVAGGFSPAISTLEEGQHYSELGAARGAAVGAHLTIDTGMGRIGVWEEEAADLAAALARLPCLRIIGISSHLPSADEDFGWTRQQLERFHRLAGELRQRFFPEAMLHIENSAGLLGFPLQAGDLVRPGLLLYGSSPLPERQGRLRPALTWKTRVTLLRDVGEGRGISYGRTYLTTRGMRVATLAVGYADGFRRHLSGRGADVLLGGRRCALLGRVTMDQIVVDASAVPGVQVGDESVLIGRQGEEEILASEHAERAGTIPWDIFTGLGPRIERVILE